MNMITGYVVTRIGGYSIIEGTGRWSGYWFARGHGELARFERREDAEMHAHYETEEDYHEAKPKGA